MDAPLDVAIAAQTCRVRKRALVVVRLVALSLSLDGEQCTLLTRWLGWTDRGWRERRKRRADGRKCRSGKVGL